MYVPFIGRLSPSEWPFVAFSFVMVYFEFLVSIITKCIPGPLIELVTSAIWFVHTLLVPNQFKGKKIRTPIENDELKMCASISRSASIQQIGELFGYDIDDHIVPSQDGYLLCLHRIKPKQKGAPVIYLHHGLLMCSDIWVVNIKRERNLPFVLHELGFDVWMGNNRGNKYSANHIHLKPTQIKFWDFSIDEFAMYDIPDSISYVLKYTNQPNLTYIGFSQGSAQAFAALSIKPELNRQIKLLIALAPAMTPSGLHHQLVDSLVKTSPNIMYLIFGKKALLPSAAFWKNIIYAPLFCKVIDFAVDMLFNWKNRNIQLDNKVSCFAHLYSPTSVKSVVHWFQIIRNGTFQMYDEDVSLTSTLSKPFRTVSFPTKTNIQVPIKLVYGTTDSLVDIDRMLKLLPQDSTDAVGVPNHEHLDIIWGDDIEYLVFPYIFNYLNVKQVEPDNQKVTATISSPVPEEKA